MLCGLAANGIFTEAAVESFATVVIAFTISRVLFAVQYATSESRSFNTDEYLLMSISGLAGLDLASASTGPIVPCRRIIAELLLLRSCRQPPRIFSCPEHWQGEYRGSVLRHEPL